MSEIGDLTNASGSFDRRRFLQGLGGGLGVAMGGVVPSVLAACGGEAQPAVEIGADAMADVSLGTSIRSLSNPYHALWKQGGEDFAASVDAADRLQTLLSEGDSAKQLRDMRALIARAGNGNVIVNVDPNEASDALPIARLCERSRCYFVTSWNKPDDLHPWDFKYWVSHMTADDVAMGKQVGEALVHSMNGRGKMGAILGLLGNTSSQAACAGSSRSSPTTRGSSSSSRKTPIGNRGRRRASPIRCSPPTPTSKGSGRRTTAWPSAP
jgi:ABC-type sugar transport system substrate-binding protein